jgi:hypothetical protein
MRGAGGWIAKNAGSWGQLPGHEASISKLVSSDLTQRMIKFSTRLLGQYTLIEKGSRFAPQEDWMRRIRITTEVQQFDAP